MAQYYLLSSKSKNINLKDILRLTEEDAFHLLKTHRWGNPIMFVMYAVRTAVFATKPTSLILVNVGVVNIANAISISLQIPFSLFIRLN